MLRPLSDGLEVLKMNDSGNLVWSSLIETGGVPQYSTIAIDGGNLLVAFKQGDKVYYGYSVGGGDFVVSEVYSGGTAEDIKSISLSAEGGNAYMVFESWTVHSPIKSLLYYAEFDELSLPTGFELFYMVSGWDTLSPTLEVMGGVPHVVMRGDGNGILIHAYREGGWDFDTLEVSGSYYPSLIRAGDGLLLAYKMGGVIELAYYDGGEWIDMGWNFGTGNIGPHYYPVYDGERRGVIFDGGDGFIYIYLEEDVFYPIAYGGRGIVCGVGYSYPVVVDPTLDRTVGDIGRVRRKVAYVHGVEDVFYFKVRRLDNLGMWRRAIGGVLSSGSGELGRRLDVVRNIGCLEVRISLREETRIELEVYDVSGRCVYRVKRDMRSGERRIVWEGEGMNGRDLRSGVYFYRVRVGDEERKGKLVLIR
jgi:hypothetical protein